MIEFSAKYIPSLLQFTAKKDIRYYLESICISPHKEGGCLIAATDGHKLLLIRDKDAKCEAKTLININPDAVRFCKGIGGIAKIDIDTQRLTIFDGFGFELYVQAGKCMKNNDAIYPNINKVLPNFSDLKRSVFDPISTRLLSDTFKAHPGSSKDAYRPIRLWQTEPNKSVCVEFVLHPEIMAIIMPMRDDSKKSIIIDWHLNFHSEEVKIEEGKV